MTEPKTETTVTKAERMEVARQVTAYAEYEREQIQTAIRRAEIEEWKARGVERFLRGADATQLFPWKPGQWTDDADGAAFEKNCQDQAESAEADVRLYAAAVSGLEQELQRVMAKIESVKADLG